MNRIKELRNSKKLSQAKLAEIIGCTPATISKYELEQCKLPGAVMSKLCKFFECTADYLLGFSDENRYLPDAEDGSLPQLTRELLVEIPRLSSEEQEHIREFIRLVRRD